MQLAEYARCDAVELAHLARTGAVRPDEILAAAREAVAETNDQLNAVLELYEDVVPVTGADGSLFAVPILRKDLGVTEAGRLIECGSRLLRGVRAGQTTAFARLVQEAGGRFIGRSTTPEFGISSSTESVAAGITRNPWDLARMAGGSSGGACAAVASRMVPIAHASDGGGSIRIPAAACGILGLKPSRQRVSISPSGGDSLYGLATSFFVSRSIRDLATALDVVGRPQPGDPFIIPAPSRGWMAELAEPLPRLSVAVDWSQWGHTAIEPDFADAAQSVARLAEGLGHRVTPARPDLDFDRLIVVLAKLFALGMLSLDLDAEAAGKPLDESLLEPVTLANLELARRMTSHEISTVFSHAGDIRRRAGRLFAEHQVLITPGLAAYPPEHGRYSQSRTDLSAVGFMQETQYTDQYFPLFNVTGQPALIVPVGVGPRGLPLSVQLVGRFGEEHILLALGREIVDALPPMPPPPIRAGD